MYDQSALLADLETSLANRSSDWRSSAMRRLTALFLAGHREMAPQHVAIYDLILPRFIDTVDQRTLADISASLATSPNAPPATIDALARHRSAAVAVPVLESSPCVMDATLCEVAENGEREMLLAVARRAPLNAQVGDTLLGRSDPAVCRTLFANPGASISEMGYVQMIDTAAKDPTLHAAICARADIPAELRPFFEMATAG